MRRREELEERLEKEKEKKLKKKKKVNLICKNENIVYFLLKIIIILKYCGKISICEEKKIIVLFILFFLVLTMFMNWHSAISLQDSTMKFLIYVSIFFRFNKIMVNYSLSLYCWVIVASRRLLSMKKTQEMSHATLALAS